MEQTSTKQSTEHVYSWEKTEKDLEDDLQYILMAILQGIGPFPKGTWPPLQLKAPFLWIGLDLETG